MFDNLQPVTCQCGAHVGRSKDGGIVPQCCRCSDVDPPGMAIVQALRPLIRQEMVSYLGSRWSFGPSMDILIRAEDRQIAFDDPGSALVAAGFHRVRLESGRMGWEIGEEPSV